MITAIIFDFFDVFRTDSYKAWLLAKNIPYAGGYKEASRQQDMGKITNEQFLQRLSDLQGRPITAKELDATARVDIAVVALAKRLQQHYKLALLSNAPSPFIRGILKEHDLEPLFDEIIVSSEVGMVKPNRDIFELVLKRLGVGASEAIFIDDNPEHVAAARNHGIRSIQFVGAEELEAELKLLRVL